MDIISVLSCIFFFFSFFFPLFFSTEITKRLKVSQFALKSPSRLLDRVIDLTRIVLLSLYNNCYELSTRLDKIPIAITHIKEPSLLLRVLNLNVRCVSISPYYNDVTPKIHTFRESDERTLALLSLLRSKEARGLVLTK